MKIESRGDFRIATRKILSLLAQVGELAHVVVEQFVVRGARIHQAASTAECTLVFSPVSMRKLMRLTVCAIRRLAAIM